MGNCLGCLVGRVRQVLRWPHYLVPVFLIASSLPKNSFSLTCWPCPCPDWFVPIPLCPWLYSFPPLLFSYMDSHYLWNNFDKMLVDTIAWSISLNLFMSVSCWRKIGFSVILFNFHIPNNSEIKGLVIDQSGFSCINVFMPCRKRFLWASTYDRQTYN